VIILASLIGGPIYATTRHIAMTLVGELGFGSTARELLPRFLGIWASVDASLMPNGEVRSGADLPFCRSPSQAPAAEPIFVCQEIARFSSVLGGFEIASMALRRPIDTARAVPRVVVVTACHRLNFRKAGSKLLETGRRPLAGTTNATACAFRNVPGSGDRE
jgi:hypothetical protein